MLTDVTIANVPIESYVIAVQFRLTSLLADCRSKLPKHKAEALPFIHTPTHNHSLRPLTLTPLLNFKCACVLSDYEQKVVGFDSSATPAHCCQNLH